MQVLRAVAHAEHVTELAEHPLREPVPTRKDDVRLGYPGLQPAHPLPVGRVALVVAATALQRPGISGAVDLVGMAADRWQPAGQEGLRQPTGCHRHVVQHAEATEGLTEHAPAFDAQLVADELSVFHDRIGTETGEVASLLFGAHGLEGCDRRRPAGSPLVEHEHAEVLQGTLQPAWYRRVSRRARRLHAGTSLQKDEKRSVAPVRCRDLPGKHRDPLAVRI